MLTMRVQATGNLLNDPDIAARFDRAIQPVIAELGALGQRLVVDRTPRGATFALRGSVVTDLRGAPGARQAVISSSLFYTPIVEQGRRPGRRPPVAALLTWVVRRLGVSGAAAERVAFLVSRKIGDRGYAGYRMFERGAQQLVPIAEQRFNDLTERLRRLLAS